jgi:hypothetical protein
MYTSRPNVFGGTNTTTPNGGMITSQPNGTSGFSFFSLFGR